MYEGVVQDLIDELGRLPGVGPKSAQRIAFHILQAEPTDVRRLAQCLMEVKAKVRFCATCGNVAQEELCNICRDPRSARNVTQHLRLTRRTLPTAQWVARTWLCRLFRPEEGLDQV